MKRSLTALDLAVLLGSSLRSLEGGFLRNVYSSDELLVFRIFKGGEYFRLMFHPRLGCFLSRYELGGRYPPTSTSRTLRKFLRDGRVRAVGQVNFDRILCLYVRKDQRDYRLYLEWVREGNLVLTTGDGTIIYALRERRYRDRALLRGERYVPPPRSLIDPLTLGWGDSGFFEPYRRLKAAALFARVLGLPGEIVSEALHRIGVSPDERVEVGESLIDRFAASLREVIREALAGRGGFEAKIDGEVVGVYPFEAKHLGAPLARGEFPGLIDAYFVGILEKISEERVSNRRRIIEDKARRLREEALSLREAAAKIAQRAGEVGKLFDELRRLRNGGVRWDKIELLIKGKYPYVREVDVKSLRLRVDFEGVEFWLDASKSPMANASRMFQRAKELERKSERALEVASTIGETPREPRARLVPARRKAWYESYRYFISSDGFLVVGGRDASQNESLVRKHLDKDDVFVHAEVHGGPVVIIKSSGSSVGERTIWEAAVFAASYSRGWEAGLYSLDVYWVRGDQVSKRAPSGEYLGRGAFMVYGSRNYVRGVPLMVAVGIEVEDGKYRVISGPPGPIEARAMTAVVLRPGSLDRRITAKKLAAILSAGLGERGVKVKLSPGDIIQHLPGGGFYIERVLRHAEERG